MFVQWHMFNSDFTRHDEKYLECRALYSRNAPINNRLIFQYRCSQSGQVIFTNISAAEVRTGIVPAVCQFPEASHVSCEMKAINGAGESPLSAVSGYTSAESGSFNLSSLTYKLLCLWTCLLVRVLANAEHEKHGTLFQEHILCKV